MATMVGRLFLSLGWLRLNVEPSVPLGVYRLHAIRAPLPRGVLVLVPVPRSVRRWHGRRVSLLKPIAAVAGEVVCMEDNALWIGDESYGQVYRPSPSERRFFGQISPP